MSTNIVPQLSDKISFHSINKEEYFIHQIEFDHRVKISKKLHDFLQLIDGKKKLDTLVGIYNDKHNEQLTISFANDFLYNKLAKYGIVQCVDVQIRPNEKPNYLKFSFVVINEKIVSKFTKYLKFLFLPKVMKSILVIAIVILTICFYIFYSQIFYANIAKTQWLLFFFLGFIGVTFHEFGHASAAHYFGAKHGGIGGGFYLFRPVYYADVTDIWKLRKGERIIVNLAGMYFELVYTIFLVSIGILFNCQLLIVLPCIYSIGILFNLNPLVRSDGYWVLSDALEKPNLMDHGAKRIKQIFKSKKNWKIIDYFLLLYGSVSYVFMILFIYYIVIKNPDSVIYFPQNVLHFVENIFINNSNYSLAEFGKLLMPFFFYYMVFGWLKALVKKTLFPKK
ncbi:peptidase, M50 family protein [Flavobacterium taihuense]|uniref:Peptidase, M50 family protein n=1 Tax=Flavobacterium taihuense TaxID=2857508 RepID=A0ABS6XX21_9FLAO|nr:peptidase, M50 family protein [Flavobacterium taihuense]MBW4361243.1 peptidase, M50 family protein [Flavobacterium taihuense]